MQLRLREAPRHTSRRLTLLHDGPQVTGALWLWRNALAMPLWQFEGYLPRPTGWATIYFPLLQSLACSIFSKLAVTHRGDPTRCCGDRGGD